MRENRRAGARGSPNADARPDGACIDTLIVHYTGMPSGEAALARLCDPDARVSAHYLIEEDGTVFPLVPEELRAWHAGVSAWRGREGLNDCSIGIELVNPGHEWGYRAFPERQYEACIRLCAGILDRWPIPARHVLAHSDVAPDRKQDPGELFDWARLARGGIGLWPADGPGEVRPQVMLTRQLERFGYTWPHGIGPERGLEVVTRAFQRHFQPGRVDGVADRSTLARLDGLLALL